MKITWIGHSCFKIEENGFTVVFDPYEDDTVPGCNPVGTGKSCSRTMSTAIITIVQVL